MTDQPDPTTVQSMEAAAQNANLPETSGDLEARQPVAGDVPDRADDVVAWLEEATDVGQAAARADLAEAAENDRPGDNRVSVMSAIEAARTR